MNRWPFWSTPVSHKPTKSGKASDRLPDARAWAAKAASMISALTRAPVQEPTVWPVAGGLVAGFLCLGAFLRIYNFWTPDLWIDEYVTWWGVAPGDWADVGRRVTSYFGTPPLYYFIVKLSTDLLGVGALSLRLPSILFGIGVLGLLYPLGMRIFHDRHAALLALAIFAVNEQLIWYSQKARAYALILFCTMLSFLFYVSLLQAEKLSYRIGYVLATVVVCYTHYLFGFVVVIQLLHLFWARGYSWLTSRRWQLTFLLLALLCLPGGIQFLSLLGKRELADWLPPRGMGYAVKLAIRFLQPRIFPVAALVLLAIGFRDIGKDQAQGQPHVGLLLVWYLAPIL